MKEYTCKKDFYIEDMKFASIGDTIKLLPDGTTVVNVSENQKVIHMQGILNNKDHFVEITHSIPKINDNVNHPKHYTRHPSGIECIDITRHYCFTIGNAIKYLWRAGLKTEAGLSDRQKEIEDLKKAVWYINDRIKQLEK